MLIYLQMIETGDDRSKFIEIYESYRALMFFVAKKRLSNDHDAEDAVHSAFVKIAENIKKIEPVSPKTKRLVVIIVEHIVFDMLKKQSRHVEYEYLDEVLIDQLPQLQDNGLLSQCILKLPENYRHVIWLKYYYGYTLREISKLLGISLSSAQKTDQRAKKKLEELYKESGGII